MKSLVAAWSSIKIKIPLLMLGPYLRGFLYCCMAISGGLAILLFILSLSNIKQPAISDDIMKAAMSMLGVATTVLAITILLHVLGMP